MNIKSPAFNYTQDDPPIDPSDWRVERFRNGDPNYLMAALCGRIYDTGEGHLHMLCQTEPNVYKIIGLDSGNRWDEKNYREIPPEWRDVTDDYIITRRP
jgi:hypothetical protein